MNRSKHTGATQQATAVDAEHPGLVSPDLSALMAAHDSPVELVDSNTLRCRGVRVSREFNKPKTNLLLRRMRFCAGCNVHVDSDLVYMGREAGLVAALAGPCHKNWRKLGMSPLRGSFDRVLMQTLAILGSPLAEMVKRMSGAISAGGSQSRELGPVLRNSGEFISLRRLATEASDMVRPGLAEQVAKPLIRTAPPSSVVLSGEPGCGRDSLIMSAAHLLTGRGFIQRVFGVAASRLAAGHVFPADLDSTLVMALSEAAQLKDTLIIIQDLDVSMTHSPICHAALVDALDRGIRLLATFRSSKSKSMVIADAALSRRLVMLPVVEPDHHETVAILRQRAERSPIPVREAAIHTVMLMADRSQQNNPAAAVSILSAAIAEAVWQNAAQVGPDEVFAGRDFSLLSDRQED